MKEESGGGRESETVASAKKLKITIIGSGIVNSILAGYLPSFLCSALSRSGAFDVTLLETSSQYGGFEFSCLELDVLLCELAPTITSNR
jgi:hypothetical protein